LPLRFLFCQCRFLLLQPPSAKRMARSLAPVATALVDEADPNGGSLLKRRRIDQKVSASYSAVLVPPSVPRTPSSSSTAVASSPTRITTKSSQATVAAKMQHIEAAHSPNLAGKQIWSPASSVAKASSSVASAPQQLGPSAVGTRAKLTAVVMEDFKTFEKKSVSLDVACGRGSDSCGPGCDGNGGAIAVIGPNSAGKTSILEAIKFVLMRDSDDNLENLIRRCKPARQRASVTAHFEGGAMLRREVLLCSSSGSCSEAFWLSGTTWSQVSREEYVNHLAKDFGWPQDSSRDGYVGELLLSQFAMLEGHSAAELLQRIPTELSRLSSAVGGVSQPAALLKRKRTLARQGSGAGSAAAASPASNSAADGWRRLALCESQLVRHVDEIYTELTREPPAEDGDGTWGDGGEASLRRIPNSNGNGSGEFSLAVSQQRGAAACGYGVQLQALSDGSKDLCAIALMLALAKMQQQEDAPPAFVILDEPDSRLDKRHARALWRYLRSPWGPRQCIVTSLNNHRGLDDGQKTGSSPGCGIHVLPPAPTVGKQTGNGRKRASK